MQLILANRLGGLSLCRNSVVRLTDYPHMTITVYCGRKTTTQILSETYFTSSERLLVNVVFIYSEPNLRNFFHPIYFFLSGGKKLSLFSVAQRGVKPITELMPGHTNS